MIVATTEQMMISTSDNPFSPFTEWDEWKRWDEQAGYYTCEYLARVTRTSDELSFADQERAIEDAIDEIATHNITGNYIVVTHPLEENSEAA